MAMLEAEGRNSFRPPGVLLLIFFFFLFFFSSNYSLLVASRLTPIKANWVLRQIAANSLTRHRESITLPLGCQRQRRTGPQPFGFVRCGCVLSAAVCL